MRQLITRIDDDLHASLQARARAEGRSVASLVREVLANAVSEGTDRASVVARFERAGLVVRPPAPVGEVPTHDEVVSRTRGAGRAVSAALEADRAGR